MKWDKMRFRPGLSNGRSSPLNRVAAFLLVLAIGLGSSPSALAQAETVFERIEFSGSAGWSGLTDDVGTLGNGGNTAGGVAFYVVPSLAVGVEVNRTVHSGFLPLQNQFRRSDGKVTFASVNASYYFVHGTLLGTPAWGGPTSKWDVLRETSGRCGIMRFLGGHCA